ncbi:type II toxin-antitoxin system RelE family toxin [Flavobacterium nackdongense]|uniref:Type II toxin-antitoxin system RelE/ParE family toxin n=1 Tax=Flavobacterium nackdongense TaxID=2547394 RepID=A0A4V1AGR5_9FLAO|nr:type II toxin-antitoxin system RelE/ParE family toxin [Flavobacterium nackdongense]QBN18962.1 type II toxin-antitoxin system RelE/ParE family toxin [Flavobacterium nackdongense]
MIVTFDKSFSKSLDKIGNAIALKNTSKAIEKCEMAKNISEIPNLKKLKGYKNYYRIKIGDYRIGVEIENETIDFILITHRKNIYNLFP